jgi:glycine hydroxymethyltransferase
MEAAGSVLTNKYAEDILAKDTTEVAEVVDVVEQIAIDRAKELLEQRTQMYSPHKLTSKMRFTPMLPGDKILGFDLSQGFRFT